MALVDWQTLATSHADTIAVHGEEAFFTAATRAWLAHAAQCLGEGYRVDESDDFLLLNGQPAKDAAAMMKIVQQAYMRVGRVLPGIARAPAAGKLAVLLLGDQEAYYRYVSQYGPDGGEYGFSGGMFIDAGRPHIVLAADNYPEFERVIAHEMTHLCLRHLELPMWLDEGIAVNTEERLCGQLPSLYTPTEMQRKHARYWNPGTIQELWSGNVFHAPDEGQMLGYDLARNIALLMARQDFDAFRRFAEHADRGDAGDAAAREHLGTPLHHFAGAILGDGDWRLHEPPEPESPQG